MTIAVLVKVNDGLVFASDSAVTFAQVLPTGQVDVANIYNNANKIFNLCKGMPISAMAAGLGNVGTDSISTLAKDLRLRFSGQSPNHSDWELKSDYTMDKVVERVKTFFYDEHYQPYASTAGAGLDPLELIVGGYDGPPASPKAYQMTLSPNGCNGPNELNPNSSGVTWTGMPEAIYRLLMGVSSRTPEALVNLGVSQPDSVAYTQAIAQEVQAGLVHPAMPIGDAIGLAEFLVQVTIGFVRFCPGDLMVGGPIEVAAVTRHEGFKWVQRKHYYDVKLNPVSDLGGNKS